MNPWLAAGLALAGALLVASAGLLRWSAAGAAAAVAWAHLAGGGGTAALLLATFVISGSLLTRRLDPSGPEAARRGAPQVLANGGPAAFAALLIPHWPVAGWPLLAGALAAAQADTWATEIGRTSASLPRDLWTGARRPAGTSGAVTWRGSTAGVAGAAAMAAIVWPLLGPVVAGATLIGGTAGMLCDSALGGTAQARYLCTRCGTSTESSHHCGVGTRRTAGLPGVGNSVVNAVSTAVGAMVAWLAWGCWHWWH